MSARITEALRCVTHALMVLPLPSDGQGKRAWSSLLEAQKLLESLSAEPGAAERIEPGTVRICAMRDGPCPHGLTCPYVGDGYMGYPCKEGWNGPRALSEREGQDGLWPNWGDSPNGFDGPGGAE